MGLIEDLGFEYGRQNRFHRAASVFFSTRPGAWIGALASELLDRSVFRLTAGGNTAVNLLTGLEPIWLTTTGARSKQPRRHALFALPFNGDLAVIGSNFGQPHQPAWVFNLFAHPHATIEYGGQVAEGVARPALEDEKEEIWHAAAGVYPGYLAYRGRVSERDIKLFVLEPA